MLVMTVAVNAFLGWIYFSYGPEILATIASQQEEEQGEETVRFYETGDGVIISEDGTKKISFSHDLAAPKVLYENNMISLPNCTTIIMD